MEQVKLNGIQRYRTARTFDPDSCNELINLRREKAAWVGIKGKKRIKSIVNESILYIHDMGADVFVIYQSDDGSISYTELYGSRSGVVDTSNKGSVKCTSLNNILVVASENAIENYVFTDGAYGLISTIGVSLKCVPDKIDPTGETGRWAIVDLGYEEGQTIEEYPAASTDDTMEAALACMVEAKNIAEKKGIWTGEMAFQYSIVLFDGTEILHGAPIVRKGGYITASVETFDYTYAYVWVNPTTNKLEYPSFTFTGIQGLSDIKSIVKGVKIYASRPLSLTGMSDIDDNIYNVHYNTGDYVPAFDITVTNPNGYNVRYPTYLHRVDGGTSSQVDYTTSIMREIAFVPVEKVLQGDSGSLTIDYSLIDTMPAMPVDSFSHHTIGSSRKPITYNGRVFVAAPTTTLSKPFPFDRMFDLTPAPGTTYTEITAIVEVKTDAKTFSIVSDPYKAILDVVTSNSLLLSGLYSYPDFRASKVTILFRRFVNGATVDNNAGLPIASNLYYKKEYSLIAHETQNISTVRLNLFAGELADNPVAVDLSIYGERSYPNPSTVRASSLNNTFNYPVANSYTVGKGSVLALEAINSELSQGQFGDYPMIAFTSSGIWAMNIGSDVLITNVVPLVNEICTSVEGITAVRKGILFPTNEGLKILQGSTAINISDIIKGSPSSPCKDDLTLQSSFGSMTAHFSDIDFIDYLIGAKIGYDTFFDELIISRPDKAYSYVFSIDDKLWTKRSDVFDAFFNQFPYMLAVIGDDIFDTSKEDGSMYDFAIVTNPIYKAVFWKFSQMVIRCLTTNTYSFIYASIDTIKYRTMITRFKPVCKDIAMHRAIYTYKSLIVAIYGNITKDGYLTHIDMVTESRYDSKLR